MILERLSMVVHPRTNTLLGVFIVATPRFQLEVLGILMSFPIDLGAEGFVAQESAAVRNEALFSTHFS
jgi:hypothetical protein